MVNVKFYVSYVKACNHAELVLFLSSFSCYNYLLILQVLFYIVHHNIHNEFKIIRESIVKLFILGGQINSCIFKGKLETLFFIYNMF